MESLRALDAACLPKGSYFAVETEGAHGQVIEFHNKETDANQVVASCLMNQTKNPFELLRTISCDCINSNNDGEDESCSSANSGATWTKNQTANTS